MTTMIYLSSGNYTIPNGSLIVIVHKVQFQNDEYVKFKGSLMHKTGGWVYETKNYKLLKKNISHWEKEFLR